MNDRSKSPLITTIIPTYRRPRLLRRAIESALEQEGVKLIVGVFDNASGDETNDMVSEWSVADPRIRYHLHEQNLGAVANFEYGLRSVTTPFFSILSDDDYLLPGFYRRALDDFARYPEAMFWAGLTLKVDEGGRIWEARLERWAREGLFYPAEGLMAMMHGMAPTWTGIVFRREILDRIGLPDRETLGPSDLDFTLKAAAACPFILRKHPSAVFTLNSSSFSATQPLSSFWPGWQKIFLNLKESLVLGEEVKEMALAALHQDARRMLFRRGANALANGRYDFARGAAQAFIAQYGNGSRPFFLRILAFMCERFAACQWLYASIYRELEQRLINSRSDLQSRFGNLLRALS